MFNVHSFKLKQFFSSSGLEILNMVTTTFLLLTTSNIVVC